MNCHCCGEEIGIAVDYVHVCQKCLDAGMIVNSATKELTPMEAVIAMLRGAVLRTKRGYKYRWDASNNAFVGEDGIYLAVFSGLYYTSEAH